MFRLTLSGNLSNNIAMRTKTAVVEEQSGEVWSTYGAAGTAHARWYTFGRSLPTLVPVELAEVHYPCLHGATELTAAGIIIPDMIDINVVSMDTLQLPVTAVVGVFSRRTGLQVSVPITYTSEGTLLDVSALSGPHRIFLATPVYTIVDDVIDNDDKVTIHGYWQVCGVNLDNTLVENWNSIQYADRRTVVDFGAGYSDGGILICSPGYLLSAYLDANDTYLKIPVECPAAFLDDDLYLDDSVVNAFNGFTSVHLGELTAGNRKLLVAEWTYHFLKKYYGNSFGFAGASVPTGGLGNGQLDARYKGYYETLLALEAAYPTAERADWAWIGGTVNRPAVWNVTTRSWVLADSEIGDINVLYTREGTVVANRVYYLKEGVWTLGDVDDEMCGTCALYIARGTNAAVDGMTSDGLVNNNSWNWTTPDAALYLAANGTITETVPTRLNNPGEVARVIAHVVSATQIRFRGYIPGCVISAGS